MLVSAALLSAFGFPCAVVLGVLVGRLLGVEAIRQLARQGTRTVVVNSFALLVNVGVLLVTIFMVRAARIARDLRERSGS